MPLAQLQFAQNEVARYQTILHQAEAAFYRGQGTRTEIEEAKARLDGARAQVLARQSELESEDILARSETAWVDEGKQANLGLLCAKRLDIRSQQLAGHNPTLDFVASYKQSRSESEITLEQQFKTSSIAVKATLPLFWPWRQRRCAPGRALHSAEQAVIGTRKGVSAGTC